MYLSFHFIKHSSRVPLHLTFKILQRMLSLLCLLFLNFRQLLDLIFTFPVEEGRKGVKPKPQKQPPPRAGQSPGYTFTNKTTLTNEVFAANENALRSKRITSKKRSLFRLAAKRKFFLLYFSLIVRQTYFSNVSSFLIRFSDSASPCSSSAWIPRI